MAKIKLYKNGNIMKEILDPNDNNNVIKIKDINNVEEAIKIKLDHGGSIYQ